MSKKKIPKLPDFLNEPLKIKRKPVTVLTVDQEIQKTIKSERDQIVLQMGHVFVELIKHYKIDATSLSENERSPATPDYQHPHGCS